MKLTYNKILNNMKNAFYESAQKNVDLQGDLGLRFQAVASELYSIACYGDYILKQAFPQTATKNFLDYHAQLRDIKRKEATKAYGVLTFVLAEVQETDVEIPKGTLCSVCDLPYIQFETKAKAVIKAGDSEVSTAAAAVDTGESFNAAENTVCVMVNPPMYVQRVYNKQPFTGGHDAESDEALRKRILSSYSVAQTGVSAQSIKETILKIDGIWDCSVSKDGSRLKVKYVTSDAKLTEQQQTQMRDALMIADITSTQCEISAAGHKNYSLTAEITLSSCDDLVKEKIESAIKDYLQSLKIGEFLYFGKLNNYLMSIDGVRLCELSSPYAAGDFIPCPSNNFLKCFDLKVNFYE